MKLLGVLCAICGCCVSAAALDREAFTFTSYDLEVRIEPDVFKSKDQEMLQELMLAAVNEATRRVDEELSKQMKDLTGGMSGTMGLKIPGLF